MLQSRSHGFRSSAKPSQIQRTPWLHPKLGNSIDSCMSSRKTFLTACLCLFYVLNLSCPTFMRLGGCLLCLGVVHFLKLLGGSMPKLDVSAISSYVLLLLSDLVYLSVLWVFVAGLPTIAFIIETFISEAWNSEQKMVDVRSADGSVSEGDGISEENRSGIGYYKVSDKWSSWNRDRSFKGGNRNGGYDGGVGRLNNGSRYTTPSGVHNGAELLWRQNRDVFNNQGSDVTQQRYILPMANPDAFTAEKNILQYPVPPSQLRNLWSQQPPAPTWSQNYTRVRVAFSNMCIYANAYRLKSTASWLVQ
jgi:hypothetical protein